MTQYKNVKERDSSPSPHPLTIPWHMLILLRDVTMARSETLQGNNLTRQILIKSFLFNLINCEGKYGKLLFRNHVNGCFSLFPKRISKNKRGNSYAVSFDNSYTS